MPQAASSSVRLIAAFLLLVSAASSSLAGNDPTPPEPLTTVAPKLQPGQSAIRGQVAVKAKVNKHGLVEAVSIAESSHPALDEPCLAAMQRWTFQPAQLHGKSVATTVIQPFVFNEGSISIARPPSQSSRPPKPIRRVAPDVPESLASVNGYVNFVVELDAHGKITRLSTKEASHKELIAPAEEALRRWRFRPALENGQTVASTVIAPFSFKASPISRFRAMRAAYEIDQVHAPPQPLKQHEPVLPLALERERGEAWLLLYVDQHGYVADASTLKTTNPALSKAATQAALSWTFKPAMKDGAPVASKVAVPFHFNEGLLLAEKPADKRPRVKRSVSPQLPQSLKRLNGYVRVVLDLDERGQVVAAKAKQSSHPDLVGPTVEAAKKWTFKPAIRDGQPVPSTVLVPFTFDRT